MSSVRPHAPVPAAPSARGRRTALLIAAASWAVAAALAVDLATAGFPDGHRTAYERASAAPLTLLAVAFAALGGFAALWALPRPPIRRTSGRLVAAAASVGALILVAYLGVPWYLRSVLGLEHGGGG
jgi:hypothetical protein